MYVLRELSAKRCLMLPVSISTITGIFFPESNTKEEGDIILLEPVSFFFLLIKVFFEGVGINKNWKIRNIFKFLKFVYTVITTLVKFS